MLQDTVDVKVGVRKSLNEVHCFKSHCHPTVPQKVQNRCKRHQLQISLVYNCFYFILNSSEDFLSTLFRYFQFMFVHLIKKPNFRTRQNNQ